MLRELIVGLIVAGAISSATLAKNSVPDTLTRSDKWVVDYDRDACHLYAQFGTGDDILIMRLTRYEPGDSFDFGLYGKRVASADVRSEMKLDFGLRGSPAVHQATNGKAGKMPLMLFGTTRLDGWERTKPDEKGPLLTPQQEAAVSSATIQIRRKSPFRLEFGSLGKPMEQLRTCQSALLKSWGYDPIVQMKLSRPARPTNAETNWLNETDYPLGALAMGQNGIVQFRLDIGAEGKIAGCHVLARTNPDVFADTTCGVISRRAKFDPALDADGRPVRSFYVRKVLWTVGD